jgi:hypothetical protein
VRIRVSAHAFGDDQALAQHWARAIAAAIQESYHDQDQTVAPPVIISGGDHAVIYLNDAAALTDLVESVTRGDLHRQWAWQQLRMIDDSVPTDPVSMIISGCRSLPQVALPVLAHAARRGWLDRIVITWPQWQQLADVTVPESRGDRIDSLIISEELIMESVSMPMRRRIWATLQLSPLRSIMIRSLRRLGPPPRVACPQLTRLALAVGAPELVATAELIMVAARQLFVPDVRSDPDEAMPTAATDSSPLARAATERSGLVPSPQELWTRFSGLLFLLHLSTVQQLADPPMVPLSDRPLSWTLAAIGHRLTGAPIDDPAILAFGRFSTRRAPRTTARSSYSPARSMASLPSGSQESTCRQTNSPPSSSAAAAGSSLILAGSS